MANSQELFEQIKELFTEFEENTMVLLKVVQNQELEKLLGKSKN